MRIIDSEGCPNPARARIALAEKGATDKVEFVPVDVMGGEHRTDAFKAKNPDAVVPCLELADGTYISQCNAITEYIDGHFEGPSLTGKTPKQRTQIAMMNLRAENEYLARADFSAADTTAFAGLVFADFAKVEISQSLSNLTAWRAKVAARPSIAG